MRIHPLPQNETRNARVAAACFQRDEIFSSPLRTMKPLALVLCVLTASASAQPATPVPKKKAPPPFGSALDRNPTGPKATPPPATPPAATSLPSTAARGLSFEARQIASGGSPDGSNTARTSDGQIAKTRVRNSQTTLEIQVRNLARETDTAHFDWFFVAKSVITENTYVWDKGERDVPVPAASQKKETVESEELAATVTRTTSGSSSSSSSKGYTSEKKSGSRPYGWIVRMSVGGQVVKVQASNSELDKIARDPAQLTQLLKQTPPTPPTPPATPAPR